MTDSRLLDFVGLHTLQQTQDRFAALGRMTVWICGTDGELLTMPTWGSRYSELIGTSPRGAVELREGLHKVIAEPSDDGAVTLNEGMKLHAKPIRHDGDVLAMIVLGIRAHKPPTIDEARRVADLYGISQDELIAEAGKLNPLRGGAPKDIQRFAELLADIIATLYGQSARIEQQLEDLRTVHDLAELLSGSQSLDDILNLTVRRVVEVMPVKACAIRLLNPDTGELVIRAVHNLSEEYLSKGPVLLKDSRIDSAAFTGRAVYIEDARTDPRIRYPDNARREGIVSGLCVPLSFRGQTIGVIRVYTSKKYAFTESEESLLRSIASQAAAAVIHHRMRSERIDAERMQRQIEAAGQIQQRMLPSKPPMLRGITLGCAYDPTLELGGDFYDFVNAGDRGLFVCNADVMGKGLGAALLMASVRAAFRAHAVQSVSVADLVQRLNRQLFLDTNANEFVTAVFGLFSPDGRTFTYCNAGHPPPILFRGTRLNELLTGGMVLGVLAEQVYEQEMIVLQKDDVIVIVTDGVTEAMDFQKQAYGQERYLQSLRRHRKLDAPQIARQILWDVRRFVGLAFQSDDISIVVARANRD
ncbi:MAG: SpoIIE family protein phosphatase [Planctomycetes bacterium]|nr:SpoIIE family protein phosphatase [Planctomycetota bacterium]MBI3834772.1 SpoIIE family protein phosphatase [Planctomycetota bacterium]